MTSDSSTSTSAPAPAPAPAAPLMTAEQKTIVAILAFLQFTVIVDFMIMAPLGALLMDELHIDTRQFGFLVSAAAFSAGVCSFAMAGIADRFDRKRLLLFVYAGFILGTALCGIAPSYEVLLGARIVTGMFGGVISSITMAIVADLFPLSMRGRVMGTMMTSLSAAQIAGVPAGLALSSLWSWHAPFLIIAGLGAVAGVGIAFVLKLDALPPQRAARTTGPFAHMRHAITTPGHWRGFATTILLSLGFMLHPLLTAYFVNNLHVDVDLLPIVFMVTGVVTFIAGPLVGKLADSIGKLAVFAAGSGLCSVTFVLLANLSGATALWMVVAVNALLFAANTARMIAAGALTSAVPAPQDRGAFMSINASLQQLMGGVVSAVGGWLVVENADGTLARFDVLCCAVVASIAVALVPMWIIDRHVKRNAPLRSP
jgi:predicted MFS family arabinose efflux permease